MLHIDDVDLESTVEGKPLARLLDIPRENFELFGQLRIREHEELCDGRLGGNDSIAFIPRQRPLLDERALWRRNVGAPRVTKWFYV